MQTFGIVVVVVGIDVVVVLVVVGAVVDVVVVGAVVLVVLVVVVGAVVLVALVDVVVLVEVVVVGGRVVVVVLVEVVVVGGRVVVVVLVVGGAVVLVVVDVLVLVDVDVLVEVDVEVLVDVVVLVEVVGAGVVGNVIVRNAWSPVTLSRLDATRIWQLSKVGRPLGGGFARSNTVEPALRARALEREESEVHVVGREGRDAVGADVDARRRGGRVAVFERCPPARRRAHAVALREW